MKVVFEFNGRETSKIAAVMAALGCVPIVDGPVEKPQPKPRAKRTPKPEPESKPEPEPEPLVLQEAPEDNTRLNDIKPEPEAKESKPEPKRRGGGKRKFNKLPKETWLITDCLFVGMFVASTGRECGVAGVSVDDKTGNVRLAFIDKDCETASTEANWFVDPAKILDRMVATKENAEMIKAVYN